MQRAYSTGRMSHAYIFCGADGVGKFSTASAWAKMLLCKNKNEITIGNKKTYDSCGNCRCCKVFQGRAHPDINIIYKELIEFTRNGKGRTTPVDLPKDVINEFLIEKAASKPKMGEYAVYIVKESDRLNPSSQNALLKVLEEPPSYCVIILLCNSLEKLLPTTRSRCQIIRFGQIDENIIVGKLVENSVNADQALYWARLCESSLGNAMAWASLKVDENSIFELKKQLIRSLARMNLSDCVELARWMGDTSKKIAKAIISINRSVSTTGINRKASKIMIRMAMSAFSDVMRIGVGDQNLVNIDQKSDIRTLAAGISPEDAADKVSKAYENLRWVDSSVNEKLINFSYTGSLRLTARK